VQDTDGVAVGCEHLGQALVAVGRFIQAAAAQHDVAALQPALHHLRLDQALALDDAGLAIDYSDMLVALIHRLRLKVVRKPLHNFRGV
jgi:hypothetical protein